MKDIFLTMEEQAQKLVKTQSLVDENDQLKEIEIEILADKVFLDNIEFHDKITLKIVMDRILYVYNTEDKKLLFTMSLKTQFLNILSRISEEESVIFIMVEELEALRRKSCIVINIENVGDRTLMSLEYNPLYSKEKIKIIEEEFISEQFEISKAQEAFNRYAKIGKLITTYLMVPNLSDFLLYTKNNLYKIVTEKIYSDIIVLENIYDNERIAVPICELDPNDMTIINKNISIIYENYSLQADKSILFKDTPFYSLYKLFKTFFNTAKKLDDGPEKIDILNDYLNMYEEYYEKIKKSSISDFLDTGYIFINNKEINRFSTESIADNIRIMKDYIEDTKNIMLQKKQPLFNNEF